MPRTNGDWYMALIVAAITVAAVGAVFYITVWTAADPEWFKFIAFGGFTSLLTLLTQKDGLAPDPPPEVKKP